MKSPFKFLDAFTLADRDAFFGRDEEIESLYTLVHKANLLLMYGLSGTGKTSLIQCGLASRFDGPDWYPIFIRRRDNINSSLHSQMSMLLKDNAKDNLVDNVSLLLRHTLRPVYLIFDQIEELFILGEEEEQKTFMNSIRQLLDARFPAKVIFIMREEYIAQLYNFEELIPELFDHRFRVEPMRPAKVKNVILSSLNKFRIKLAEPQGALLDKMVSNISDPRHGITLPYVQVYLDIIFRYTYQRQYPDGVQTPYTGLSISEEDLDSIGVIDNVLERFLDDRIEELQNILSEKYFDIKPQIVQRVLEIFVSPDGTKQPVYYHPSGDVLKLKGDFPSIRKLTAPILTEILHYLENNRVLRQEESYMELGHDSLASVIYLRRSEAQRQLENIRKRLLNAYDEYLKTGAFLNQRQLASFEEYEDQLALPEEIEEFLDQSAAEAIRKIEIQWLLDTM